MFPSHPRLLGVIHLLPLPSSPDYAGDMAAVIARASADADALIDAGFDGFIVENFGDAPFFGASVPAATVAAMTRVVCALPRPRVLGINVLRNDASAALGIAAAVSADFIRVNVHISASVTDQGVLTGRAAETLRERKSLGIQAGIAADVDVKHAAPLAGSRFSLVDAAQETAYRGRADALIVSGAGTGKPTSMNDLQVVRQAVPDRGLWVGSGATIENAAELLTVADTLIVGTATKLDGITTNPVCPDRAQAMVVACRP